jgi:hypothetical protein
MGRKRVGVLFVQGVVALLLALPELAFGGAGGVAVVGGGAEGALLAAVADEAIFDEDGEEEEDAVGFASVFSFSIHIELGIGGQWETYAATIATAKQAVSNLHAVRKLGSTVNPPFPCGTVFATLVFPLPKGVFTYPLQLPSPPRVAYAT